MDKAPTEGSGKQGSTKQKIMVPTTPIILSYIIEKGSASRNEITKAVYDVSSKLRNTNVRVNATFRGNIKYPDLGIESEAVDSELWYWLSNKFIVECDSKRRDDLCFKVSEEVCLKEYKSENLRGNLKTIRWGSVDDANCDTFVNVLQDVIGSNSTDNHE